MTETELLNGIIENDELVWRHIYRDMRQGFVSIILQKFALCGLRSLDIDDVFQESLLVLMRKVKDDMLVAQRNGGVFSYLVTIGTFKVKNLLRKKGYHTASDAVTIPDEGHYECDTAVDEKQNTQDEFIDRVFDTMPAECRQLLKLFYWERKPMDDIASILGLRNADSAKTKKSKCMNKFKDIAAQLVESDEFAEDVVRAAVERAALKELLEDERFYAENGIAMAALDIDEDNKDK